MPDEQPAVPARLVSLRDGQPPAWVFTSPCCGKDSLVAAWMIRYVRENHGGRLTLQCGRSTTDPIREVGAVRVAGCGKRYTVDVSQSRPPNDARQLPPDEATS